MTNAEYKELYQAAQLKAGTLTNKTRLEILKAYKQAANLAASAVKDATERGLSDLTSTHWQNIENQLKAGATIISNKITTEIPIAISKAYANVSTIDEDFIMDAVKAADNTVITSAGIKAISASINEGIIQASATRLYETGYTLSESIWNTTNLKGLPTGVYGDYQYRIKNLILTGQAQGRDAVSIAKDIQVYVAQGKTAVFKAGRYGKLVPGTAGYAARISSTVDWRALRIVRTELYSSLKLAGISEGDMNPAATGEYDWNKNPGNPEDINGSKNTSGRKCITLQRGSPYSRDAISSFGQNHPNCFADGTEVYTSEGWKDFRDVDLNEKFLSVNPDTLNYEWVRAIDKQEFKYNGEAIRFKSKWLELITTPGHNNFVSTQGGPWRFETSSQIMEHGAPRKYPRYFDTWAGTPRSTVKLGDYELETKIYCEFMGYYLSEGHVSKHSGGGETLFGGVTQLKEKNLPKMQNLFDKMPFYFGKSVKGWYFYDQSVCNDLKQYGKSWEKYVPEPIFNLDKASINIFLDAYILGDGNIKKRKVLKGGKKAKNSRSIATSSKMMADGLGELILKAGGYPSFYNQEAKWIKHKNGTYLTKHPAIVISLNRSKTAQVNLTLKPELIPYDGLMLDVTLEKNHILWVRYKGKTCFSGNCGCTITPRLIDHEEFMSQLSNWEPGSGGALDTWYRVVYSAT